MRRFGVLLIAFASAAVLVSAPPVGAQDYKQAPPAEELDERAEVYVTNRRIMAIVLVGGTFVAGLGASILRRRARRRAAREAATNSDR